MTQGQTFYGSMVGTVTDSTGAVVPDTAVTLTNVGTGEKRTVQTDSSGFYQFLNLTWGTTGSRSKRLDSSTSSAGPSPSTSRTFFASTSSWKWGP